MKGKRITEMLTVSLDLIESLTPAITYLQKYCNVRKKKSLFVSSIISQFSVIGSPLIPTPSRKS